MSLHRDSYDNLSPNLNDCFVLVSKFTPMPNIFVHIWFNATLMVGCWLKLSNSATVMSPFSRYHAHFHVAKLGPALRVHADGGAQEDVEIL